MPGQVFGTANLGGYLSQPELSRKLRFAAQPLFRFRQIAEPKEAWGRGRGDTFVFNKVSNIVDPGGPLNETQPIPQSNFTISRGQVTMTEYGLAVPFTGKLEALSEFDITQIIETTLRHNMVKTLEKACGDELVGTEFVAVCTGQAQVAIRTDGTPGTNVAQADLTAANVRQIVDFMRKRNVPPYDGQNYICVASVQALSGMFADAGAGGWVDIAKYTPEYAARAMNGEVGTYYKTRFLDETGYLSNTIGSGNSHGQAVFVGADSLYEAIAVPEEIRINTPTDYGRSQGIAWYAILGFKRVWNFTTDGEQHIVFVTSA